MKSLNFAPSAPIDLVNYDCEVFKPGCKKKNYTESFLVVLSSGLVPEFLCGYRCHHWHGDYEQITLCPTGMNPMEVQS